MKKIWVCGSSGMLGSHLMELLKGKKEFFIGTKSNEVDITQLEQVSDFVRLNKISHIINCAAYTQVDRAELDPSNAYQVNANGPLHLAIAANHHGVQNLIHISTDYVFSGTGKSPYDENHPCTPLGVYGLSKLEGENKMLNEFNHSCIVRTSWLFGHPGNNFVKTMLRLMSEKESLNIVADQIGRPTYCQDLAGTILRLFNHNGIFHFANSNETSWFEFTQEIYRQAKLLEFPLKTQSIHPILTIDYPTPAKRPAYSTLCTNKIEKTLGFTPRPWQEALQDYLKKLKNDQYSI